MAVIHILDHSTIDKIAAGEVVERPSSVVKELVENAIDAGSQAVTVEIKEGGISFIRVSDNGCGIDKSEIRKAFMRHATSKISDAQDLNHLSSLGFRGEALSSISAVSRVELITKTREDITGVRVSMEGPDETSFDEVGAPDGTTIMVRNLFFNVPVRKKFLKQPATEAGYIADLMEHLALSNPQISFKFVQNGQIKFSTPGNGNLKEVIYRIYGKEIADSLIPITQEERGITLTGFLGKPSCNRSNRNFEIYFLNGRFIKSSIVSKAIEDGYHNYVMQHKYPFCVIKIEVDPELVDVNVHPTKMDVRFSNSQFVFDFLSASVKACLDVNEMIPDVILTPENETPVFTVEDKKEPFQKKEAVHVTSKDFSVDFTDDEDEIPIVKDEQMPMDIAKDHVAMTKTNSEQTFQSFADQMMLQKSSQMNLFEERILTKESRSKFRILGQLFETYWIVAYEDKMLMVDQHAAHEKVKYERFMKAYQEGSILTQNIYPPLVLSLTSKEQEVLNLHADVFASMGFELESFGGNEITIRTAPVELYGTTMKEMFLEVLDELMELGSGYRNLSIEAKIASMSCKAAVKGNTTITKEEMDTLLDELLTLENPYFCPHGRPTMISFSKYELEKKFKRIV